MSGIAFQKLNGGQTTANKQLEKLELINSNIKALEDLALKPEIYKLASMYAPNLQLTPIQFSGILETSNQNELKQFSDGNLYYGTLQICVNIDDANKNNARHHANLDVVKGGVLTARFMHGYKGSNDWPITTGYYNYVGFFDSLFFSKSFSHSYTAKLVFEFQGFVLGEKTGEYIPPTEPTNDFYQLIVNGNLGESLNYKNASNQSFSLMPGVNEVPKNLTSIVSIGKPFLVSYKDVINAPAVIQDDGSYVYLINGIDDNLTVTFQEPVLYEFNHVNLPVGAKLHQMNLGVKGPELADISGSGVKGLQVNFPIVLKVFIPEADGNSLFVIKINLDEYDSFLGDQRQESIDLVINDNMTSLYISRTLVS
ncbi:hypothetical protein ACR79P_06510 [Sphingobacterium spiritivorum]|uniref:hypothetical protein n=1 Tax=Sphingobacterium spiritivorum TaxID=258 RepID=UPI003DA426D7